jgi:hypothetical protein
MAGTMKVLEQHVLLGQCRGNLLPEPEQEETKDSIHVNRTCESGTRGIALSFPLPVPDHLW